MTNNIAKIRAALEQACEYIRSDLASERGAFEGYEGVSRIDEIKADLANNKEALAALAELERAAAEPVAWMWDDMLIQRQADQIISADARIAELESALKRQAAAVKMLDMSHVARAETMMQHAQVLRDQSNTAALESERAANALLTDRVARLETELEFARIAERERNSLRDFANAVMDSWPHGDVDGYELERMAVEHGLLSLKDPKPTEPCCDNCACSGYPSPEEWAEGIDCYVRTPLLKGDAARAGNGGGV